MQLYEVLKYEGGQAGWSRTLSEAHADAKLSSDKASVRIRLYDYPADQQAVCGLFNGVRPDGTLKRMWRLTARGGLQELGLDGKEPETSEPELPLEQSPDSHGVVDAQTFWADLESKQKRK